MPVMANNCESCPRNCCFNFQLTRELFDPQHIAQVLKEYPYISKTGVKIIRGLGGRETAVGVYNCARFDGIGCENYDSRSRLPFCLQTGNNFYPHKDCLLIKK